MENLFFDKPILNSPYEYPARHWELDAQGQPTAFAEFTEVYQIESAFKAKIEKEFNKMIGKFTIDPRG